MVVVWWGMARGVLVEAVRGDHAPYVNRMFTVFSQLCEMSNYMRPKQSGACLFITVALADRRSDVLVKEVAALRDAVAITRVKWPFTINAMVVLPNHFHAVITLPERDAVFSTRVRLIKARFSRQFERQYLWHSHVKRSERGI